jgi:4-amino-4-deoxy-L-arabinose transferase-like glycosyltransferase
MVESAPVRTLLPGMASAERRRRSRLTGAGQCAHSPLTIAAPTILAMSTLLSPPMGPDLVAALDATQPDGPPPRRARRRWWRQQARPAWSVPARAAIVVMTTVLYTWNLGAVGTGNSFYAAAVKSGTLSWKAFFFGSLDPGNFITVDKPPASLWVMELSGRIFGFSSWSMLLPEAVAGVATVMIVYRLVRRWAGEVAAVLASVSLALTPIAVAMFRYNNPDALLTLLLVGAAWAVWSAIETGKTNRLVIAGSLVGMAFTTKMLEAFIVLPALALVYLWCGSPRLRRRVVQLVWAGVAVVVASGWWVAIVEVWPASARPYLGGSTDNSELNLIFGYNGLSRIFGSGGSGRGGGANFGGATGILRMFNDVVGGQVSWLLPAALVGIVAAWLLSRGRGRTSLLRAGTVLWSGWLLMYLVVFSDAKGTFHPYYTVVLAPAVAALTGAGVVAMWRLGRRSHRWSWMLPVTVAGSAVWAAILLERTTGYYPWLPAVLLVGGALAAVGLLVLQLDAVSSKVALVTVATVAALTMVAGPAAYAATTIANPASGSIISAGPSGGGSGGVGFGGSGTPGVAGRVPVAGSGSGPSGVGGGTATGSDALDRYLVAHKGSAHYLVAVSGSQSAAPIILATGQAVMAMGGFTGSDPSPTLAQFVAMVKAGEVHYVLVGGNGGGGPASGSSTTSAIDAWAVAHGSKVPASAIGGTTSGTLYYVAG